MGIPASQQVGHLCCFESLKRGEDVRLIVDGASTGVNRITITRILAIFHDSTTVTIKAIVTYNPYNGKKQYCFVITMITIKIYATFEIKYQLQDCVVSFYLINQIQCFWMIMKEEDWRIQKMQKSLQKIKMMEF